MIIKFEPHGFVVFFTLAMGMIYAIFNSRSGWGFWKLALISTTVVPFLYYGFVMGRVVEVVVGSLIGWLYAKGGLNLPSLNPFSRLGNYFEYWRVNKAHKKAQRNAGREQAKEQRPNSRAKTGSKQSQAEGQSNRDEEAYRRAGQARKQRSDDQAKSQANEESSGGNGSNRYSGKNSQYQSNSQTQKARTKSKIEEACEVLGIERTTSYEDAKRAYRRLMSLYHPDRLAGLSGTRREQAESEAKLINVAWHLIGKWKRSNNSEN